MPNRSQSLAVLRVHVSLRRDEQRELVQVRVREELLNFTVRGPIQCLTIQLPNIKLN